MFVTEIGTISIEYIIILAVGLKDPRYTTLVSKQHQRMTRVLTCLGMVSVLLLTSFVTNVYAAETSDLGVSS
jgi:hypothetical protein